MATPSGAAWGGAWWRCLVALVVFLGSIIHGLAAEGDPGSSTVVLLAPSGSGGRAISATAPWTTGQPLDFQVAGVAGDLGAVKLVIIAPDGTSATRAAFARQDGTAGFRHVARLPGLHRWQVDAGARILAVGACTIAAGTGPRGPIGPAANHRLLAWADGTPFIPIGPNYAWIRGGTPVGFAAAFRDLARHGCTHTRLWLCSWSLPLFRADGSVDLAVAEDLDAVLAAARRMGIRLTLVVDNHTDLLRDRERRDATLDPGLPAPWRARWQYLLARWGADDAILAWELCNEADLAAGPEELRRWVPAALAYIRTRDPDCRLRTVSLANGVPDFSGVDLLQVHRYVMEYATRDPGEQRRSRDAIALLEEEAGSAGRHGRPWLVAEWGFQGGEERNPGNERDPDGLLLRQGLWGGFLLGGCGGAMDWWWDAHIEADGLLPRYRAFAATVARIDWRDPDLQPLAPNPGGALRVLGWRSATQALLWPQLRQDTWYEAVDRRRPRRGPEADIPVRIPGFSPGLGLDWLAIDPVSGAVRRTSTVTAGAGRVDLAYGAGTVDEVWVLRPSPP